MKAALILACIVVIGACAMSGMNTMPPASVLITAGYAENSESENLERGRILAVTECTECHRIYWPAEFMPLDWSDILDDMGGRASLEADGVDAIRKYYVTAARHAQETQ
jgi:hypothetical protein